MVPCSGARFSSAGYSVSPRFGSWGSGFSPPRKGGSGWIRGFGLVGDPVLVGGSGSIGVSGLVGVTALVEDQF